MFRVLQVRRRPALGWAMAGVMLVAGLPPFCMERRSFPVAPSILGVVLGTMLEEYAFSSLVKADAQLLPFFKRRFTGALGAVTLMTRLKSLGRRRG